MNEVKEQLQDIGGAVRGEPPQFKFLLQLENRGQAAFLLAALRVAAAHPAVSAEMIRDIGVTMATIEQQINEASPTGGMSFHTEPPNRAERRLAEREGRAPRPALVKD